METNKPTTEYTSDISTEESTDSNLPLAENSSLEQTTDNLHEEKKKVPWGTVIATSIFIALPAAVPLYFSTVVENFSTKIIFLAIGILVVIFNVIATLFLFQNYFKKGTKAP